jgi:dipeptidyl-peptidase-4
MRRSIPFKFLVILLLFSPAYAFRLDSQMPQRGGRQVRITGWTDDNHYLIQTFNSENKAVVKSVDIRTGKGVIVPPKKSERELFSESLPAGVTIGFNDIVSSDLQSVIIVKDNDLYYFRKGDNALRRLTNNDVPEVNARYSPDNKKIAYTKNKDLYVFDLVTNKEIRLSFDATDRIYNGYSSWVYMEEIYDRPSINPYAAFWWSPDGNKIAYLRTDETEVPVFTLNRLDEADGIHGKLEQVPYPKAGDPNPKVKMGIADIATAKTIWVKTDYSVDQYIAWPFWKPDSKELAIQVLNRDQNDLKIILTNPATGGFTTIYNEARVTWVEFFEDVYVMKNGTGFILRSYKNDWVNLFYYGWDGKLISQITNFTWSINKIERIDEEAGVIYFTGTGPESTDSHFFRIGLDGKNLLQVTKEAGEHYVSVSPKGSYIIDTWNNITTPGSIVVYDNKAKMIRELYKFETPAFDITRNSKSELLKIPTSDGLFNIPAIITFPVNFDPSKKYPVVFTIYGGPGDLNSMSRKLSNTWQGIDPSWYSTNGIITFKVDHRGSGHFGKRGLDYLYRSLGKWEILDYEDAVKWLLAKPYIDGTRMGITGSSYGGYMTCLALTKGADYWTHGFAGSSVTDWRLYDDIYTERYMDTPQDNPDGYKDGSTLTWAKNYKGKLYMTHGDLDDNVHMQNSIFLISRLEDEGKSFQFMLYPNGRHGWSGAKATHSRNEANKFWLKSFFGKE